VVDKKTDKKASILLNTDTRVVSISAIVIGLAQRLQSVSLISARDVHSRQIAITARLIIKKYFAADENQMPAAVLMKQRSIKTSHQYTSE
jgi:hypothetical protein